MSRVRALLRTTVARKLRAAARRQEISVRTIAELNRDFVRAALTTDQLGKLPPKLDMEE